MKTKTKIIYDLREERSGIPEMISTNFEDVELEGLQLTVGDYLLSQDVAVERKSGSDLVASIIDGRLWDELTRLRGVYPIVLLLLEEPEAALTGVHLPRRVVEGALNSVQFRYGVPVKKTANKWRSVEWLTDRAERLQKKPSFTARMRRKRATIAEERVYLLEGLRMCGPVKAKKLLEAFSTPDAVFSAIKDAQILRSKGGRIKGVEGDIANAGRGFGPKFVENNQKLLGKRNSVPASSFELTDAKIKKSLEEIDSD